MIRNCGVLQVGDSLQAIFNGTFDDPQDFVSTLQPDSSWFWPEHGMVENDTLKIFMSEFITNQGPPGWNFEFRDTYLVFFTYPGIELLGMEVVPYHSQNEVMYGNQILVDGSYTYIYGRKDGPNNVANAHIARVATGNLSGPWEFFDGSGWTTDATASAWIMFQSVSQQYAVFNHQGKYVLLTQQIWLGQKIFTLTSNAPQGPWGNLQEIYTTPLPFPDMFTYNAWAHPQFDENNQLLVSYNSNGDFWAIFNNVELYRPTFLRVPFELIDSTFWPTGSGSPPSHGSDDVAMIHLFPNPASGKTTLSLEITAKSVVAAELFDSRGIKRATYFNQELLPGHHQLAIDLADFPEGIYYFRVGEQVKKLIRIE